MKLPPAWIGIAAVGLAISLAIKHEYEVDYLPATARAVGFDDLSAIVTPGGFQIDSGPGPNYLIMKDGCLGWIGYAGRDGDFEEAFQLEHARSETLYYYRGRISRTPPFLQAQIDRYREMLRVVVGARPRLFPLLHIALGPACPPSVLDPLKSP
jgi:hypothetical protein